MGKKYIVRLSEEENKYLDDIISKGKSSAQRIKHAHILLKSDANQEVIKQEQIAKNFGVHVNTVIGIQKRFVLEGLESALNRKKRDPSTYAALIDGEKEARLIAMSCGKPPDGFSDWSLRLLADQMVELSICEQVSYETVRKTLKKNGLKPHLNEYYCIPPEQNGDFVACMEDVLDIYKLPYDKDKPVICMDEQPIQLIKEIKTPLPMKPGKPQCFDYEYERNGTTNVFMFVEPLGARRYVEISQQKTKQDWAREIKKLLCVRYPDAKKVVLVMDNLATHKPGALYDTFPPEEARALAERIEIHYTPKHGSWLNIAECELSVLTRQCLNKRVPDVEYLKKQTNAWEIDRNKKQKGVVWQFTTADARTKLLRLYPEYTA